MDQFQESIVQPTKINGKTIEERAKYWVNSWFE